jgi:hypothetical protein
MIGLVKIPKSYVVHLNPAKFARYRELGGDTVNTWPWTKIGDTPADGITVEAYDDDSALNIAAHRTGVSQGMLVIAQGMTLVAARKENLLGFRGLED